MLFMFLVQMHGLFLWKKKSITITNAFQKVLDVCNRKPKKRQVDKGTIFFKRSMKSWLQENVMEMHSTRNEKKHVVTERFTRTLENKI